jgi:hypothetical protein
MSTIGRMPPPLIMAASKAVSAEVPHNADPGRVAQQPAAVPIHHRVGHHSHHTGEDHAPHAHGTPHAPKPRRPPKPRKGRRKNSLGEVSDEDELDIGDEASPSGATPVSFDGGHQDGGDNHDQGDGDSKREDRTQRARFDKDDAPSLGSVTRESALRSTDTAFASNRYHRGICNVLVGPQPRPDAAARIVELDLELMGATTDVAKIDSGGIARARANLLAHAPPVPGGATRPAPDSPEGRLNCIAVMKELQLQLRRSAHERQQTQAHLEVRQRARTR